MYIINVDNISFRLPAFPAKPMRDPPYTAGTRIAVLLGRVGDEIVGAITARAVLRESGSVSNPVAALAERWAKL